MSAEASLPSRTPRVITPGGSGEPGGMGITAAGPGGPAVVAAPRAATRRTGPGLAARGRVPAGPGSSSVK
jgi:hypothetical protein